MLRKDRVKNKNTDIEIQDRLYGLVVLATDAEVSCSIPGFTTFSEE
jgi:hypothetical protein